MASLSDLSGLEWCAVCKRLLTLSSPEDDCVHEFCPGREFDAREIEAEMDVLNGPKYNKGTESGWH